MRGRIVAMIGAGALTAVVAIGGFAGIAHVGDAVIAHSDEYHIPQDTPTNFDPTTNDTISSPYTFSTIQIESDPSHGTATIMADKKTIHYVPDAGYVGADSMEYNLIACFPLKQVAQPNLQQNCANVGAGIKLIIDPAPVTTTTITPTTTTVAVVQQASSTTAAPVTTVAPAAASLPRHRKHERGLGARRRPRGHARCRALARTAPA